MAIKAAGVLVVAAGMGLSAVARAQTSEATPIPGSQTPGEAKGAGAPAAGAKEAATAEDSDGKRLLRECGQAIKRARAITFNAKAHAQGSLAGMMPSQEGMVRMLRVPAGGGASSPTDKFAIRVTGKDTKGGSITEFDTAFLPESIEWVDHAGKKVVERGEMEAREGGKLVQSAKFLRPDEYLKADPFGDLSNATATLEGTENVDGTTCEIVSVTRASKQEKWYIASEDRLPRKFVTALSGNYGEMIFEMTNVKVETSESPALALSEIRVPVPGGYAEDRRKAPPRVVVQPTVPTAQANGAVNGAANGTATPAPPSLPPPPRFAPDFELSKWGESGADGKVKLSDLRGSVVVLDFFGTWSIPAPAWHKELEQVAKAAGEVEFLSIDVREKSTDAAASYMRDEHRTSTLLLRGEGIASGFGVRVFPAVVVVGKDGAIIEIEQPCRAGGGSKAKVADAIRRAMGSGATPEGGVKTEDAPKDGGGK